MTELSYLLAYSLRIVSLTNNEMNLVCDVESMKLF